ncbi:MAG: DUF4426 domain-containing protein [Pseudomonadales bacterium]|jgi:hypothetical protein|nr:DUF4426 domain-containing protein [Pseudomonadales bacterium]
MIRNVFRHACWATCLALLALTAQADQFERYGDLEVHYIVFNTTDLDPEIAARYGIVRDPSRALVNIAGRRVAAAGTTTAVPLAIEGTVENLLGQKLPLAFQEVREPGAIYYLATLDFTDRETLRFALALRDLERNDTHRLAFQKALWVQ